MMDDQFSPMKSGSLAAKPLETRIGGIGPVTAMNILEFYEPKGQRLVQSQFAISDLHL